MQNLAQNELQPLILLASLLAAMFAPIDGRPLWPNYLVEEDFANAIYVKTNRPVKFTHNDQRFHKRQRRDSVVANDSDKWPNGRIPYVLSSAYTPQQRAVLARAIGAYNTKTCIRFVPKLPQDKDYVVISKLDGCFADFARVGGRQQVSLADECVEYATIIHEFMHVVGFIHEHQREDRDGYVRIVWENVIDDESTEGSKNGRPTLMAMVPEYTMLMGKSTDFTEGDLNRVNKAYKCHRYVQQTAQQQQEQQKKFAAASMARQRWARQQYWRGG